MKSQLSWLHSSHVWALTYTYYSTGSRVCCWWWQPWKHHHPPQLSSMTILTFTTSYLSPHSKIVVTEHKIVDKHACPSVTCPVAHQHIKPTSTDDMKQKVVFFHCRCKENNVKSTLVVGQARRPVLFTCRPYIDVIFSAAFQQEEGCGSFEAQGKHHVQPLSIYFITYMLRSMTVEVLYVTLVSAYDGWSSTAAERGTGTGTGNAHRWMS